MTVLFILGNERSGYLNIETKRCMGSKPVKSSLIELFKQKNVARNKVTLYFKNI